MKLIDKVVMVVAALLVSAIVLLNSEWVMRAVFAARFAEAEMSYPCSEECQWYRAHPEESRIAWDRMHQDLLRDGEIAARDGHLND